MEITYLDKIYKMLYDLKPGKEFNLTDNVDPENMAAFIQHVKDYINAEFDHMYGFVIEFSNDYTKIRKHTYFQLKNNRQ